MDVVAVKVIHVGGPWDGLEERREIHKTATEVYIAQQLVPAPAAGKPWLRHRYDIVIREVVRLVYRGYEPSDTFER